MATLIKRFSLWVMAGFYFAGGINHFRNPDFYLPLIPDYLPWHWWINAVAGIAEVALGLGLLFKTTKRYAAYAVIVLLILFIPSHVYFIQIGGCIEGGLCAPLWVGWVRLVLIQPLLMLWAWYHRK